ncbi:hypothetical protein PHLGIDRAFT_151161 [Phlebiopsis gigantea 11061_1 CR5-6]|uniref:DUF6534 domain-containing protein n=1 Tax=Phlebiopsis gigantea (strain 11061_1 CR5-6) TaxID=745531 RepID=A0A0C3RVR5_PHLG1|nr:hypothetical protein PHLGIDRAFT_151161 [Phlebiopsis gigantea 11061_1 CR5-6]
MGLSEGGKFAEVLHGPSLIGIFLNVGLYGVLVTQVNQYYNCFPKDPTWIKYYVAILLIANTCNSAFNMAWIYDSLVNQFGNLEALSKSNWMFASEEAMAGIISMMAQLFYAWRIYVLTKNYWVVAVVVLASTTSGLCAIGSAIAVSIKPSFADILQLDVIVIPWLVACTVCDVIIAIALSLFLSKHKTGFSQTDTVLNKIIRSTVQSGMLTASFTIAHLVSFLASSTGIHMIFNYGVVKLYTTSVMSSLNSRREWVNSLSNQCSTHGECGANMSDFLATNRSIRPQVTINVETHEMVDVATISKRDPEWPDMDSSDSAKSIGSHTKYTV